MITLRESLWSTLASDAVDLALGRACSLCDIPGRTLCLTCLEDIRCIPAPLALSPLDVKGLDEGGPDVDDVHRLTGGIRGSGTVPIGRYAVPYRGSASTLILDYKERGNRALASGLGVLLADAVESLITQDLRAGPDDEVVLVPIPGHPRPRRGFAALPRLMRPALRFLRDAGYEVRASPLLRQARHHGPLKRMDRSQRRRAVPGSMMAIPRPHPSTGHVVIVDDVVTTGTTMLEAVRALRAAHLPVAGIAAITHSERP